MMFFNGQGSATEPKGYKRCFNPYWSGPVRLSVRPSVRNTFWQLRNARTAYARILKLYMWHVHEK